MAKGIWASVYNSSAGPMLILVEGGGEVAVVKIKSDEIATLFDGSFDLTLKWYNVFGINPVNIAECDATKAVFSVVEEP